MIAAGASNFAMSNFSSSFLTLERFFCFESVKNKEEHDCSKEQENEEEILFNGKFSFEEFEVSVKEGIKSILWLTNLLNQIFHSGDFFSSFQRIGGSLYLRLVHLFLLIRFWTRTIQILGT